MHYSVHAWVRMTVEAYDLGGRLCLEVGSYNVNGSVRDLFTGPYLGVDMRPGPGVDEVVDIEFPGGVPGRAGGFIFAGQFFDVIVSTEMLEHTPRPWRAVQTMAALLAHDGGHLLLTTRSPGFPVHEHPGDYYRFTEAAMATLVTDVGLTILELKADPDPGSPGVFCHAIR